MMTRVEAPVDYTHLVPLIKIVPRLLEIYLLTVLLQQAAGPVNN